VTPSFPENRNSVKRVGSKTGIFINPKAIWLFNDKWERFVMCRVTLKCFLYSDLKTGFLSQGGDSRFLSSESYYGSIMYHQVAVLVAIPLAVPGNNEIFGVVRNRDTYHNNNTVPGTVPGTWYQVPGIWTNYYLVPYYLTKSPGTVLTRYLVPGTR